MRIQSMLTNTHLYNNRDSLFSRMIQNLFNTDQNNLSHDVHSIAIVF